MTIPSFASLTDEQIAEKAQLQDIAAFECLVQRYENPLLRYILRISHFSPEEAEEILQEVFLKAWKNLNDFDITEKFSSWIYRITHNQTISEFRKAKSRGLEQQTAWNEEIFGNLPDKIDIPEELNQKLNSEKIHKMLDLMPKKYSTVIILNFLEEKSYDEISDILHIPPGTVATLLNRAKKTFYELLTRNHISF